jgi:uncharacterized membrane protein YphA (DoxX/SURF4 family)
MKIFNQLISTIVGGVFVFSGLIKINDPIGTAIKLEEYFDVFGQDVPALASVFHGLAGVSLGLSLVLCASEVILGIALISGFKKRLTLSLLTAMIVFFAFLTFYSAWFNKVTDCGCFGEVIKLTPWQSFWKDVILGVLLLPLLLQWKKLDNVGSRISNSVVALGTLAAFGIGIYSIRHLPIKDFSNYAPEKHIPTLMQPEEPCKYLYVMTKDGQEHEFEQYPTDKSYTYKAMRELNKNKCIPKIIDYSIWRDTINFTEASLTGRKLVIVVQSTAKANTDIMPKIAQLIDQVNTEKIAEVVIFTGTGGEEFEQFRHEHKLAAPYYFADGKLLKAMIRANPGVMLLQDGHVRAKWHYNDTPEAAQVAASLK